MGFIIGSSDETLMAKSYRWTCTHNGGFSNKQNILQPLWLILTDLYFILIRCSLGDTDLKVLKQSMSPHLPFFEGLAGKVTPASSLEERDVAPGL